MNTNKQYLLDANTFIDPKNRYYGFDICPGYWSALVKQHEAKRIFSIDRIRDELTKQDDEIKDWVENRAPNSFFKQTINQAVIEAFENMVNWVYSESQYKQAAKTEFASVADGWLVAYAAVGDLVVVTHEEYAPDSRRKVPIPNLCMEFEVEYVNVFEMLRALGEEFVRSRKRKKK